MREVDEAVFFSSQCVERTRFWMASERADCFFGAMRLPTLGLACVDDLPLAGVGRLRGLKPWVMAPGTKRPQIPALVLAGPLHTPRHVPPAPGRPGASDLAGSLRHTDRRLCVAAPDTYMGEGPVAPCARRAA